MKFYTARKEIFAQAIAQGILDGLGVKSTATQPKAEQYYRVRLTKDDEKSQLFAGTKAGAWRCARPNRDTVSLIRT